MNNVVLVGRLTRDAELRYIAGTGTPVATFSVAVDREFNDKDGKRVALNVGDYRKRREETLKALAKRQAQRAIKYRRSCVLEPMNPYERRIIHTAVQEIEGVSSHSVGEGENRRVVIVSDNKKNKFIDI